MDKLQASLEKPRSSDFTLRLRSGVNGVFSPVRSRRVRGRHLGTSGPTSAPPRKWEVPCSRPPREAAN